MSQYESNNGMTVCFSVPKFFFSLQPRYIKLTVLSLNMDAFYVENRYLNSMATPPCFSSTFHQGNNFYDFPGFLFVSLDNKF